MAELKMSRTERESFLKGVHVAVVAIPRTGEAPLTAPVWYRYEEGGELWFSIAAGSQKDRALAVGMPLTLVVQNETLPYAYVSVEAKVAEIRPTSDRREALRMAERYLGPELGARYVEANSAEGSLRVSIEPTRWLTVDYGKLGSF
jgi:nitroimidazol reductase NimA-like FMN-containing flavoprotein (pyridoxamine 5'-phosphate oxidase superfamily)